jgi:hypothetical protein
MTSSGRPAIYPNPPRPSALPEFPIPVFAPAGTGGAPNPVTNPLSAFVFLETLSANQPVAGISTDLVEAIEEEIL